MIIMFMNKNDQVQTLVESESSDSEEETYEIQNEELGPYLEYILCIQFGNDREYDDVRSGLVRLV